MPKIPTVSVPCEARENGRLKYRKGAQVTQDELARLEAAGLLSGEQAAVAQDTATAPAKPPFVAGIYRGPAPDVIAAERAAAQATEAPAETEEAPKKKGKKAAGAPEGAGENTSEVTP